MENKVLVIGLDGVGWPILERLIAHGAMPNLKGLINEGVRAKLRSTTPPLSGPAWFAIATGMEPAKKGILDLVYRRSPNSYDVVPMSSRDFKGTSIWDILGRRGWRVGIINFPLLWPPYPVNGFLVSGFGSPPGSDITFPRDLRGELSALTDGYEVSISYSSDEQFMAELARVLVKREKTVRFLAEEWNWDFLFTVFSCTDWLQHYFWKHIDPGHPLYNEKKSRRYATFFRWVFRRIDSAVGRLLKLVDEEDIVVVVSDHGFQRLRGAFNLARWLELHGYIAFRHAWLLRGLLKVPFTRRVRTLMRQAGWSMSSVGSSILSSLAGPDVARSRVFLLEHSSPLGAIYIAGRGHELVRTEVAQRLRAFFTRHGLEVEFYDMRRVCELELRFRIPDIVFSLERWSFSIVNRPDSAILLTNRAWEFTPHSGTHNEEGIFIAKGPYFKCGTSIGEVRAVDVMPTLLHALGLRTPMFVDGVVNKAVFKAKSPPQERPVLRAMHRADFSLRLRRALKRARSRPSP